MRRTALLSATAALLAACDAPQGALAPADRPSAAAVAVHHIQRLPVVVNGWVACTGDFIELTGTLLLVYSSTTNENGERTLQHAAYSDLKGEGVPSGTKYVAGWAGTRQMVFTRGADAITTATTASLITLGQGPNLLAHITMHFTFTPDGEPTAEVRHFATECTGSGPGGAA